MVLEIVTEGNPILRKVARPISKVTKSVERLAEDMLETMYEADGVGLAAPQVGICKRLIVLDIGEGPIVLFNPEVTEKRGCETDLEGCLSVPGIVGKVDRSEVITVRGITLQGKAEEYRASGLLSRALQHEIDHLDGVLFIDKATDIGPAEEE